MALTPLERFRFRRFVPSLSVLSRSENVVLGAAAQRGLLGRSLLESVGLPALPLCSNGECRTRDVNVAAGLWCGRPGLPRGDFVAVVRVGGLGVGGVNHGVWLIFEGLVNTTNSAAVSPRGLVQGRRPLLAAREKKKTWPWKPSRLPHSILTLCVPCQYSWAADEISASRGLRRLFGTERERTRRCSAPFGEARVLTSHLLLSALARFCRAPDETLLSRVTTTKGLQSVLHGSFDSALCFVPVHVIE
ncbi:hypothetical protein HPB51_026291 [Rhipicephalus microplus]|uniref:Uncharacterized protein n=1 Tax=Rhipicephalus microplus TaxID=6941 RepID=A0A9J6D8X0_RHIMP|nr:hypothetical protein HPB51_026291 [Rhipicephalus microplus]